MQFDKELEPLLCESSETLPFVPKHMDIWKKYKNASASIWTAEEIDMSKDADDWNKRMTAKERKFLSTILAFFAGSDAIVNENLLQNFLKDVKLQEARCFYGVQLMMENVHTEVYGQLLQTYIKDPVEFNMLFNGITTMPEVKAKADWALKWINNADVNFGELLVAFAVVEGIFFSGSFAAIYWLAERGICMGLVQSNSFISRDEGLHCDFACLLFRDWLVQKPSKERVLQIVLEAVEIEKMFFEAAMPENMLGMNSTLMAKYIEFVADHLLVEFSFERHFNTVNPFPFMEAISVDGKTNFFEKRVTDYSKINFHDQKGPIDFTLNTHADF